MSIVRLATCDDAPQLARTATRAFADDPLMRWFFPDPADYAAVHPVLADYLCRRWIAMGSLWCTDDGVGMAGWAPPGRPVVEVESPSIEHPPARLAKFDALRQSQAEHTPPEPHWYLNMLATHPDWQRRGVGGGLMAAVFAIAAEMGLGCYLETETDANVAYYRHHGFEVRSEWDLEIAGDPGPHMWGMWRPSR